MAGTHAQEPIAVVRLHAEQLGPGRRPARLGRRAGGAPNHRLLCHIKHATSSTASSSLVPACAAVHTASNNTLAAYGLPADTALVKRRQIFTGREVAAAERRTHM